MLFERKQIPQIVVIVRNSRKTMESLEPMTVLHTQEVTGSSPVAPTIEILIAQMGSTPLSGADPNPNPF